MVKPFNSGALYFNYKKTFSISLLAVVAADYRFIAYDIGRPGRMSDAGIWLRSPLRSHFEPTVSHNPLRIPLAEQLADHNGKIESDGPKIPYHLVGDDGFGLHTRLIKPYSQQMNATKDMFNYRLSRARQTVEVAFGILANRFRVLHKRVHCLPRNAELIVEVCILLHNYISIKRPIKTKIEREKAKRFYTLLDPLPSQRQPRRDNVTIDNAVAMRDHIRNYYVNDYRVKIQYDAI